MQRVPLASPLTSDLGRSCRGRDTVIGWASGRGCSWAIRVDGEFAEAISLDSVGAGQATIGYWMASQFRGRGLLREAAEAVVEFGFASTPEGLGLVRIEWHAYAGNVASARAARRFGFHSEGTLRLGASGRTGREDDLTTVSFKLSVLRSR